MACELDINWNVTNDSNFLYYFLLINVNTFNLGYYAEIEW